MAFRPEPKSEFGRVAKYIQFIRQFPVATNVLPGKFYVYFYQFDKDQDFKVIKLWDLMPFTFVYERYESKEKKKMFRGINFHHVPVRPRQLWLAKAKKLMTEAFKQNTRLKRIAKWQPLFIMMRKISKKSVRQYNMKNVRGCREIPNDRVEEVMRYYARTYYGVNIGKIERDYLVFRWNKPNNPS